jgi:hypothetical protein
MGGQTEEEPLIPFFGPWDKASKGQLFTWGTFLLSTRVGVVKTTILEVEHSQPSAGDRCASKLVMMRNHMTKS